MSWDNEPRAAMRFVLADIGRLRIEAALRALRGVVLRTPVKTGRARGSMTVGNGTPVFKDRGEGTQGQALSEGIAEIAAGENDPFTVTYVGSNLPYIVPLEKGSSKQAPRGMFEVTFAELKRRFAS